MKYYIYIENGKINGAGQARIVSDTVINYEVSESFFKAYIENPEKYVWDEETETVIDNPNYEEVQAQKERERIAMLNLTRGDVFRGLLLAKGITRAQIKSLIDATPATTQEEIIAKEMAYIDFEEATNYYRGNSLIDTIAGALGITSKQLDRFFEAGMSEDVNIKSNAYKYLTTVTLTINPTPADAVVLINGEAQESVTVPYGDTVNYSVTAEGYLTQSGSVELTEDKTIDVELVAEIVEPEPPVEGTDEVENADTTDTES